MTPTAEIIFEAIEALLVAEDVETGRTFATEIARAVDVLEGIISLAGPERDRLTAVAVGSLRDLAADGGPIHAAAYAAAEGILLRRLGVDKLGLRRAKRERLAADRRRVRRAQRRATRASR